MLKKTIDIAALDDISNRFHFAIRMVDAVHCAMAEGPFDASYWTDALYASVLQLEALDAELRNLYLEEPNNAVK